MKTNKHNTPKIILATLMAHLMCTSVVLSHIHAKDAVPLMVQPAGKTQLAGRDITAKALGDLHHHIDKAGLKNIHNVAATAVRHRELQASLFDNTDVSLFDEVQEFLLRIRVVASLVLRLG